VKRKPHTPEKIIRMLPGLTRRWLMALRYPVLGDSDGHAGLR
jgi:hypothetical protein